MLCEYCLILRSNSILNNMEKDEFCFCCMLCCCPCCCPLVWTVLICKNETGDCMAESGTIEIMGREIRPSCVTIIEWVYCLVPFQRKPMRTTLCPCCMYSFLPEDRIEYFERQTEMLLHANDTEGLASFVKKHKLVNVVAKVRNITCIAFTLDGIAIVFRTRRCSNVPT